ncbi:MAG TPA: NTP transferase domain-containing protein [Candidatus Eisenbacteria bacterium]|nr:NTP transferase domain-containing protein [Candidatus Eisenbacteria bacterium]
MIVGVLLAAGSSTRMGRDKALVRSRGRSFTARGLHHLWSACDAVVIVLGARAPAIRAAIESEFERLVASKEMRRDLAAARRHGARGLEARFVVNRAWRAGMLGSVRAGLKAALRFRPESILVLPVDHPQIQSRTVQALAMTMREALGAFARAPREQGGFAYALVPRHRRRRGHPLALSAGLARAIVLDRGAADLSDAVRRNSRLVGYLDTADPGILDNRNAPSRR